MNRCKTLDCIFIDRELFLCELPFVEHDKWARCISYNQDKEYLRETLHKEVRGFSADPETEAMVFGLAYHTPSQKAGEEEKKICLG